MRSTSYNILDLLTYFILNTSSFSASLYYYLLVSSLRYFVRPKPHPTWNEQLTTTADCNGTRQPRCLVVELAFSLVAANQIMPVGE
jgi:hypothetical protein